MLITSSVILILNCIQLSNSLCMLSIICKLLLSTIHYLTVCSLNHSPLSVVLPPN